MFKIYKKISFIFLFLFWILFSSFVIAEEPDAFLVKVEPSSFDVWEAVDLTINAVKDWVIVKDYIWDVFIEVSGIMPDDYIVPSDGLYSFLLQDQWTKLFSKWLEIKETWTFTVKVSDIIDDNILWETTIIVGNVNGDSDLKEVNITSPINWSTEKKSSVNVIWSSYDLRNSPVEIYLNNSLAGSSTTDSMWNFNINISDLQQWQNEIQAKVTDISDVLLWESDVIFVNYESAADGVFESIEILPTTSLNQWDKATFNVYTNEDVTSAELEFSDWSTYPLDRISPWVFDKEMTLTSNWSIDVSVYLTLNWQTKSYEDVASLNIKETFSVETIKFSNVSVDWKSLTVSWDAIWDAAKYRISYWTDRNSLQNTVDVSSTEVLIENLQTETIYYFQVSPLDDLSHSSWEPSEVVEYNPKEIEETCIVKWITLISEKIWDKYYLVRDEVENVDKYEVYRSDWADMSDMKKVWETTGSRFEYFFDKYAEKDQYAYYQVEAICNDWSNITIDDAKKVKVGPFENTLIVMIFSLFLYSIYRLYKTT